MKRNRVLSVAVTAVLLALPMAAQAQKMVENPAKAPSGVETIELKELWRVGGWDDEVLFGVITDIITDDSGNIYMLDAQLNEIQVYSSDGEYLNTIGREGEGPGEFRFAFNMMLQPGGNIGVLQAFPSKIIGLTPDGNPADGFILPEREESSGFPVLFQARNAGDDFAIVHGFNAPNQGGFTQKSILSLFDAKGGNERQIFDQDAGMQVADPVIAEKKWDVFRNRWSSGPDGRVYIAKDYGEYKVTVWNPDGKVSHVISREYAPHKRSAEDSERVLGIFKGFTRQIPVPNVRFEIEETWNPVQTLSARDDGTLWVQNSRGAQELPKGEVARYDVFDKNGKLARQLVLKGQGDSQKDGYFIVGDKLFVVTDFLDAMMALQGGGGAAEEADAEAEPMEIICYQLP
jgi:hypothetical protein